MQNSRKEIKKGKVQEAYFIFGFEAAAGPWAGWTTGAAELVRSLYTAFP